MSKPTVSEAFTAIVRATTESPTGHLPNCGYTLDHQVCGCPAWGQRLREALTRLLAEPPPIGGRAFPGLPPADEAARTLRETVTSAVAAGTLRSRVMLEVANGLTGRLNGPVERSAGRAMLAALDHAEDEFR